MFLPVLEHGRRIYGKEIYDSHVISVLEFFGYSIDDEIIIKIFGKLKKTTN